MAIFDGWAVQSKLAIGAKAPCWIIVKISACLKVYRGGQALYLRTKAIYLTISPHAFSSNSNHSVPGTFLLRRRSRSDTLAISRILHSVLNWWNSTMDIHTSALTANP